MGRRRLGLRLRRHQRRPRRLPPTPAAATATALLLSALPAPSDAFVAEAGFGFGFGFRSVVGGCGGGRRRTAPARAWGGGPTRLGGAAAASADAAFRPALAARERAARPSRRPPARTPGGPSSSSSSSALRSTPFDASLYADDEDDVRGDSDVDAPLAQPPGTPLLLGLNKYSHDAALCAANLDTGEVLFALSKERLTRRKHDGGNVALLVERCLEELGLEVGDVKRAVVNNHHHRVLGSADGGSGVWGVEGDKAHMEWEEGLGINGGNEGGYTDEENLLEGAERSELSHHLAHAYSAASQCPFDRGLIVIMDGMGETYRTMYSALLNSDHSYASDLPFEGSYLCVPSDVRRRAAESVWDWREGESVYTFSRDREARTMSVRPVFKRFVEERSPPALYNHGFERMESLGGVYSRASSHVFGDWNACGKVMGLAPWISHVWETEDDTETEEAGGGGGRIEAARMDRPIMWGHLYVDTGEEGAFRVDLSAMKGLPHVARADPDLFDEDGKMRRRYDFDDCDGDGLPPPAPAHATPPPTEDAATSKGGDAPPDPRAADAAPAAEARAVRLPSDVALDAVSLSHRAQSDLEAVVLDFVSHFKAETGETNLCLAGGVALNSVLNGRLSRELGFEGVYVPPYPGDDGIAVGCCAYGLWGNAALEELKKKQEEEGKGEGGKERGRDKGKTEKGEPSPSPSPPPRPRPRPPLWSKPLSPYLGPLPADSDVRSALERAAPWLDVRSVPSAARRRSIIAEELSESGVVALYRGRSEMGPRALGHRSLLADPRRRGLVRFVNERVKFRESFRPFAPSVLAEEAGGWFEMGDGKGGKDSPYMSLTAQVREDKRGQIPAVTHVDGSSRLQTVTRESEPEYHALIRAFFDLTGVPMVLNTSFNTLPGEPIVESPSDAVRSFLHSMGSVEMLVMGEYAVRRKDADVRSLLGKVKRDGTVVSPPLKPVRAGPFEMESRTVVGGRGEGGADADADDVTTTTRVRMPDRAMHDDRDGEGWFELLDDLEVQVLAMCDGTNDVQDMLAEYIDDPDEEEEEGKGDGKGETETQDEEYQANVFSNIMRRLTRLYEYGFVHW